MNFLKKLVETITKQVPSESGAAQLHSVDFIKTLRDGGIVMLSAGLAFLMEKVPSLDLGVYTPMAIPVITMVLTAAMRFLRDNQTK